MANRGKNRLLTTSGVANILHLHINTVRRWSNQGILKPYRIGPRGDRRFMREDGMNFLSTQQYAYKNWEIDKGNGDGIKDSQSFEIGNDLFNKDSEMHIKQKELVLKV